LKVGTLKRKFPPENRLAKIVRPIARLWLYNLSPTERPPSSFVRSQIDAADNLYGAAFYATSNYQGGGTVFELSPSGSIWNLTTFYTFSGIGDGGNPSTNVVLDSAGNIYGGGSAYWNDGTSTLYEVTP
jgi:hypothetical protein